MDSQPPNTDIAFIEFLEQAQNDFAWEIQIIQEVLAYSLDIPLRIYSPTLAKKLWDRGCAGNKNFASRFKTRESFNSLARKITSNPKNKSEYTNTAQIDLSDLYKNRHMWRNVFHTNKEPGWITDQSHNCPLSNALSEHEYWRWWEHLWLYCQLSLDNKTGVLYAHNHSKQKTHLSHIAVTNIPGREEVLVAGPVWQSAPRATGESFETNRVLPYVQRFINAYESLKQFDENIEPLYSIKRLRHKGSSRHPVDENDLVERLNKASNTLKILFNMRLPNQSELRRCDYVGITEWALFAIRTSNRLMWDKRYNGLLSEHKDSLLRIHYRLDHSLKLGQPTDQEGSSWITTEWIRKNDSLEPSLTLSHTHPNNIVVTDPEQPRLLLNSQNTSKNDISFKRLQIHYSRYSGGLKSRKDFGRNEAILELREWLNDYFGILAQVGAGAVEEVQEIARNLCHRVAMLLNADIVTLYAYNHSTKKVAPLGIHHYNTDKRNEWKNEVNDLMDTVSGNENERDRSITYRTIDHSEIQFARAFDPNEPDEQAINKRGGSEDWRMLRVSDPMRSGIAAPISVHGRPWGALEALGSRPFQFRWDNRHFIEELTEILSPFFYHQVFLSHLHDLNSLIVDKNKSTRNKYDAICEHLSSLFLSYGAGLWIMDPVYQDKYICVGCHNRASIKQYLDTNDEVLYYDKKSSLLSKVSDELDKTGKIWWHGDIGNGWLGDDWVQKTYNSDISTINLQTMILIPAKLDSYTNTIAFLSLYNTTTNEFDGRWRHLVPLVTKYIALLISAIRAQEDWERNAREVIAHELKTEVNVIRDRTTELATKIDTTFVNNEKNRRIHILLDDLEVHSKDLITTVSHLTSKDFGKILWKEKDPLVLFALKEKKRGDYERLSIPKQFNLLYRTHWGLQHKKGLKTTYTGFLEGQGPFVLLPAYSFRKLMGNLCINAIKYASHNSTIQVSILESTYSVRLKIINRGLCLEDGDKFRIWRKGHRGANVRNEEGEGKGLFLVKEICALFELSIQYKSTKLPQHPGECLHEFTLTIPRRSVVI